MQNTITIALFICTAILWSLRAEAQETYADSIGIERELKQEELKSRRHSPLQKHDRKSFTHLNYFEVDEAFRINARFDRLAGEEVMEIPTSAGYAKYYKAYGTLRFELEGKSFAITAFKRFYPDDPEKSATVNYLFLPFKDLTTGNQTYGGGRYLDMPIAEDGAEVILDFNRCYNPYCAYGDGFACPIPPPRNFIKASITAGEMAYGDH